MAQINKPSDYFNTKLYTGTGSATSITGVGFQPDLVYTTSRSNGYNNGMFDSVRGVQKELTTNTTNAEATLTTAISSFDSDGFSFSGSAYNTSAYTFVGWNWKAGTSFTNDASATGIGSVDSTGSVNTTSGFSIISLSGTGSALTAAHGLGVTPSMIIFKARNIVNNWPVYHKDVGAEYALWLDRTLAKEDNSIFFNDTEPTSSVFSLGTWGGLNTASSTIIAYCFAEKKGYSKFGSYTGNGSTDGTFVYTGFKPAFVMLKSSSSGSVGWITHDNKRIGFNPNNYYLEPNNSNAESADTDKILLLSNGFKLISTSASWNASGGSYIYMAFAENPLVGTNNIPATAR
jgi:hypothetical protein